MKMEAGKYYKTKSGNYFKCMVNWWECSDGLMVGEGWIEYMDLMNKDVDVEISEKEFNDRYDTVSSSLVG